MQKKLEDCKSAYNSKIKQIKECADALQKFILDSENNLNSANAQSVPSTNNALNDKESGNK